MYNIDTHTHIYLSNFDKDIKNVISKSLLVNKKMIMPNININSINRMMNLYYKYNNVLHPMLGLHPLYIEKSYNKDLKYIENVLFNNINHIWGIGEIGLDKHYNTQYYKLQKDAFKKQIALAKEYNLPISIHCRNSYDDLIHILKEEQNGFLKGVVHCFNSNYINANKIVDLGFYLGIGGLITFKNCNLKNIINNHFLKNIVLETDSPYLSPCPLRGKRNESYNIIYIADFISKILNLSINSISNITSHNATILFNIKT